MNRLLSRLKEIFERYTDHVIVLRRDISVMLAAYEDLEKKHEAYQQEVGSALVSFVEGAKKHQGAIAELESSRALAATHHQMFSKSLDEAQARISQLEVALLEAEHDNGTTHAERNHLVVLVAHMANLLGWRAGDGQHEGDPLEGFSSVVRIDLPTGQCSWHIHDTQISWLDHLPSYDAPWDGTTSAEKYAKIRELFGRV